jgi:hypothetical protein
MRTYFAAILAGAISVIAAYAATLTVLETRYPERLPTPAFSGVVPTDEKLRFLRERRAVDLSHPPELLAVGSSITWMHLDGAVLDTPGRPFLNGGTAFLRVHQVHAMTQFYLDLYSGITKVIMVTAITDFHNCTDAPDWILNRRHAGHYVNNTRPVSWFFLQYFAPGRYVRQVVSRNETLQPFAVSSYWMDPWGTTPIYLAGIQPGYDLRYGGIDLDPICLNALEHMADDLRGRGVDFHLVLSPVNPRYAEEYPDSDAAAQLIVQTARAIGVPVHDLHDDPRFVEADFWDAFHLQWPAAQRMTSIIADDLFVVRSHWAQGQEPHSAVRIP